MLLYRLGPIGAMLDMLIRLFNKLFGPQIEIDYEAMRRREDICTAHNLSIMKKEQQKARIAADEIQAKLEPEIQCEGCGYFHNLRRCPKCTRMAQKPMDMLYIPPDGSRPEWISAGSANITQTIQNFREPAFIDVSIAHARSLRDRVLYDLTPHKSQGG